MTLDEFEALPAGTLVADPGAMKLYIGEVVAPGIIRYTKPIFLEWSPGKIGVTRLYVPADLREICRYHQLGLSDDPNNPSNKPHNP